MIDPARCDKDSDDDLTGADRLDFIRQRHEELCLGVGRDCLSADSQKPDYKISGLDSSLYEPVCTIMNRDGCILAKKVI